MIPWRPPGFDRHMAPINDDAFPGNEFVDAPEASSSPPRIAAGNDACDLLEIDLTRRGRRQVRDVTRKSDKIGRASWRERVCPYVYLSVVAVTLHTKYRKGQLSDLVNLVTY